MQLSNAECKEHTEDLYLDFSTLRSTPRNAVDPEAVVLRGAVAGRESPLHGTAVATARIGVCDQWLWSRHLDLRIAGHGKDRARTAAGGAQLFRQKERAAEARGSERTMRREGEAEWQRYFASQHSAHE